MTFELKPHLIQALSCEANQPNRETEGFLTMSRFGPSSKLIPNLEDIDLPDCRV